MSKPTAIRIICDARDLLSRGWTTKASAVDCDGDEVYTTSKSASAWSLWGALRCATDLLAVKRKYSEPGFKNAERAVAAQCEALMGKRDFNHISTIANWNNHWATSGAECIAVLDAAAGALEQERREEREGNFAFKGFNQAGQPL